MKFEVKNRFTGEVQFTAEIDCAEDAPRSLKMGLAVKWAIKARADLSRADLYGADLSRANLYGADLYGANLSGANLYGANLSEIQQARLSIVPDSGAFEAWKKCANGVLVRLSIPADARRSNATGRKCRAEFVDVLEVIGANEGRSQYDNGKTVYRVGERVHCDDWEGDRWQDCAGGIHFFITRAEAQAY